MFFAKILIICQFASYLPNSFFYLVRSIMWLLTTIDGMVIAAISCVIPGLTGDLKH